MLPGSRAGEHRGRGGVRSHLPGITKLAPLFTACAQQKGRRKDSGYVLQIPRFSQEGLQFSSSRSLLSFSEHGGHLLDVSVHGMSAPFAFLPILLSVSRNSSPIDPWLLSHINLGPHALQQDLPQDTPLYPAFLSAPGLQRDRLGKQTAKGLYGGKCFMLQQGLGSWQETLQFCPRKGMEKRWINPMGKHSLQFFQFFICGYHAFL